MFSINETMGQYSELFMLLAAGTYTVAFIAFAWDLAKSSKMLRAVDLKAAELAAQAPQRVPPAYVGVAARGTPEAMLTAVRCGRRRTCRPCRASDVVRLRARGTGRCRPDRGRQHALRRASAVPPPGWPSR